MRAISATTLEELFANETSEVFIALVTIDHPSLGSPIRVCNNNVALATTTPPATYAPVEFDFVPAPETDSQTPKARVQIDNIDRAMTEAVRTMDQRRATFTAVLVKASDPDTVEAGPWTYHVHDVEADERSLTATLGPRYSGRRAIPRTRYTQAGFPGLYD